MANLCQSAVGKLRDFLLAANGVNSKLAEISARDMVHLPSLTKESVRTQRIAAKLADENSPTTYPAVYVFSDRLDNDMAAKFRRFSGRVFVGIDVRVTNERFEGIGDELNRYVEAVGSVLADRHGKWTDEIAFAGGFRVKYRDIELGGRNFIQSAQIEVQLEAHE
jgi:hypothetical protein